MTGLKYQWLFKYKLHHLPFWFAYHFMWWTLRLGTPMDVLKSLALPQATFKFFFYMVFQAIGVYFTLYFLIPRFLEKDHYLKFVCFLLLTIVCTAICVVSGYYVGAWILDKPFEQLYHVNPANYFSLCESGALPSTAATITLAMSIKLTKNWIQARNREQLLEKEKLETELKFLRAQFNPHFLFNTINSIFVLIHKNPDMASEALAKFSDLLRYQLYECNEHYIPLKHELIYVENFIQLQKLRQDGNVVTNVHIEAPLSTELRIAPFMVMPFVENAFKHVSQYKGQNNWIKIDICMDRHCLIADVSNSTTQHHQSKQAVNFKGIGLTNVQRRLDLLYSGHYVLNISENNDEFHVKLKLNLAKETDTGKMKQAETDLTQPVKRNDTLYSHR